MCANYVPVTAADELLRFFGVERDFAHEIPPELYPTDIGPFIRLVNGERVAAAGRFGLLPPWRREVKFGTFTYNSRSETVHIKDSFRDSWAKGLRCVVPSKAVYEPRYYDDETNERWRIEKEIGEPFGIAGLYTEWVEHGVEEFSYTMLTVDCADHPFYSQFHKPGKEKRMPVFLEPEDYDAWMSCPVGEARKYFRQWPGPFKGMPEPKKRQPKIEKPPVAPKPLKQSAPPKPASPQGDLF